MKQIHACSAIMLAAIILLSRCHHPSPSTAAVEIAPAALAGFDQQVLKELVAAFDLAEIAVQQANLEALAYWVTGLELVYLEGALERSHPLRLDSAA